MVWVRGEAGLHRVYSRRLVLNKSVELQFFVLEGRVWHQGGVCLVPGGVAVQLCGWYALESLEYTAPATRSAPTAGQQTSSSEERGLVMKVCKGWYPD